MSAADLEALFRPASIAVIGASPREDAIGHRVIRNLRKMGYGGRIYPVNPRYREVAGLPCHPSVSALPRGIEAAFLGIPAESGPQALDEVGRHGIRAAFVNASGYADGGEAGRALQAELAATARRHGIALCGPNNMGLINVHDGVAPWSQLYMTRVNPGPLAVISQSGSITLALAEDERKLGFAYLVTAGNEAVLGVGDYLDFVVRDPRVRTVLVFLETIRDPARFAAAAEEAWARDKRILVIKTGASERGRALVAAHTDSIAGDDAVYDAFFRRHGVIRVRDLDEMLETAVLVTVYPKPPRPLRVVPVSLSGGESALIADLAAGLGLELAPLAPATIARMRPAFPDFSRPQNPLDAWGLGFNADRFGVILDALFADPEIGVVALCIDAPADGVGDVVYALAMARLCAERKATRKGVVVFSHTTGTGPNAEIKAAFDPLGIPYLSGMRNGLAAMARWLATAERPEPADAAAPAEVEAWRRALARADDITETGLFAILRSAGLPMAAAERVSSPDEAEAASCRLGYPAALKGTARELAHKSELGLVRLGLEGGQAVRRAFAEVHDLLTIHAPASRTREVLVQRMAGEGVELIVSIRNDPGFGTVVVVGLGGMMVELVRSVALRLGPVDRHTALAMLDECRAGELLRGFRGRGPFDRNAAAAAVAALSRFGAATQGLVAGLEINPLIVLPAGAVAVDALLQVAEACERAPVPNPDCES